RATPGYLTAPPQKRAHAIGDVVIYRPIGPCPGPVAEVVRPALQNAVEPVAHLGPRVRVARDQDIVHLLPDSRHTLRGWTGLPIPTGLATFGGGDKGGPQEGKTLRAGFLERSLRLVQGQP